MAHSIQANIQAKRIARQQAIRKLYATIAKIKAQGNYALDEGPGDPPSWYSRLTQWISDHGVFQIKGETTYGTQLQAGFKGGLNVNIGPRVTLEQVSLIDIGPNHSDFLGGSWDTQDARLEIGGSFYGGVNATLYENHPNTYSVGALSVFNVSYNNGNLFVGIDFHPGFAIGYGADGEVKAGFIFDLK